MNKIQTTVCFAMAAAFLTGGCASLRSRIEPATVFDDPTSAGPGLPNSMLKFPECTTKGATPATFERGTSLPQAYNRFATAAYCAYFTDLEAYRGVTLFQKEMDRADNPAVTDGVAKVRPLAVTPKSTTETKIPDKVGEGPPASNTTLDEVTKTTSALGPITKLSPGHRQWLHAYLETGLELARSNCSAFFNHRERDRVESTFWLGAGNSALAGITTALINAGDHTRAAFNIATLLTGANAVGAQYQSSFVLTPELGRLHERLETDVFSPYRSAMRADFRDLKYSSFSQITQDLQRYEDLCSHKSLVRALAQATDLVQFKPSDGDIAPQNREDADKLLSKLSKEPEEVKAIRESLDSLVAFTELDLATRTQLISGKANKSVAAAKPKLDLAEKLGLGGSDERYLTASRILSAAATLLRKDDDAALTKWHASWDRLFTELKPKAGSPVAATPASARQLDEAKRNFARGISADVLRDVPAGERSFGIQVFPK